LCFLLDLRGFLEAFFNGVAAASGSGDFPGSWRRRTQTKSRHYGAGLEGIPQLECPTASLIRQEQ
jgi:hypothetical protein